MITNFNFRSNKHNQHLIDNLSEITSNSDDFNEFLIMDSLIGKTTNFDAVTVNDCYCPRCLDIDDDTYCKYVMTK